MPVKNGDKVTVSYTGTFDDGTVFDSSEKHDKPLEFVAGSGQVIKGFDDSVIGMEIGQEKTIRLLPKDAYGDKNPQLIKEIPKDKVTGNVTPGAMLGIGLPNGVQLPAIVTSVSSDKLTIDMNHPLAGKTINFKIRIVDISA